MMNWLIAAAVAAGKALPIRLPTAIDAGDTALSPANATASITVVFDGSFNESPTPDPADWLLSGSSSSYDLRMVTGTGTLDTGTVDTWLNAGTSRVFSVTRGALGETVFTGTLQFSYAGQASVIASCPVTLTASVEAP